ncbi:hypothetical protein [Tengunoibacter tsumagoiensis]|uniref:Uncharacterized protein n=1 Tax=Tengunoibacter tsumagoiensis TaxID=2014871 RepID=A0A402A7J3_9CHLR|nr:hypothetical protein [Tengunoibacter tsumagoiensis]GCE14946.1 hypothetical protein KTT_48050 [Tengunoibacter tsumagoiensis]
MFIEKLHQALLENICRSDSSITLIDDCFQEIKECRDERSCLRIAEKFVSSYKNISNQDEKDKALLIRYLLSEVVTSKPSWFGNDADLLRDFLTESAQLSIREDMQKRAQLDLELATMERGQPLLQRTKHQVDAFTRIQAHKPVVLAMNSIGMGDVLLLLPAILDFAETLNVVGSKSILKLVVYEKLASLLQHIVKDYENICLYAKGKENNVAFLSSLALEEQAAKQEEINLQLTEDRPTTGGIVILLNTYNIKRISTKNKTIYRRLTFIINKDFKLNNIFNSNNCNKAAQRNISAIFGAKMFTNANNTAFTVSEKMKQYIRSYQEDRKRSQRYIHESKSHSTKNGYICIIDKGSQPSKHVIPTLFSFIIEILSDFCIERKISIFLIKTGKEEKDTEYDKSSTLALQKNGLYYEICIDSDLAYTLTYLHQSCGAIGPDTFLIHAAEYLMNIPVVNIFVDSSCQTYRVNNESIAIEHPIAHQADCSLDIYVPALSEIYMRECIHPCTPLINEGAADHLHPLIKETQNIFTQRLVQGLELFKQKVQCSFERREVQSEHL